MHQGSVSGSNSCDWEFLNFKYYSHLKTFDYKYNKESGFNLFGLTCIERKMKEKTRCEAAKVKENRDQL